jgi:predicted RNase H-like HicB family nuclease
MRYLVIIRRTATGYSADVPDVPGCVASGTTVEHTRHMIAEALAMHLESLQRSGEVVPRPSPAIEFTVNADSTEEFCTWVEVEPAESIAG